MRIHYRDFFHIGLISCHFWLDLSHSLLIDSMAPFGEMEVVVRQSATQVVGRREYRLLNLGDSGIRVFLAKQRDQAWASPDSGSRWHSE